MWTSIAKTFCWLKARELARIGIVGGMMSGCGSGIEPSDEDGDSGGTGTEEEGDGTPEPLPGDVVECCWIVTYGSPLPCNGATCTSYAEEACLAPGYGTPCVDRDTADADGDGTIGISELQTACGQVCVDQGYDGTLPLDATMLLPRDGAWDVSGAYIWSCSPLGTINSSVVHENDCTPAMFLEPPSRVPTHIGLVDRDASAGQVQINVLGASLRPVFDGTTNLALFDCTGGGVDGGVCKLQLEGLSLSLAEPLTVGEHAIPSADLMLAGVVEAEVRFARCSEGTCTGHFQLSEQGGNPVGLGLAWVEHHQPTGSTVSQFAPLSNGSAGFGGVSILDGLVSFDPASHTGTLLLQGSGRDTFGDGAFASALFRLELDLAPRTQQ
jgi:hypothetical protein